MNIFGGSTSENSENRGPRGFRGKDGSIVDLSIWMPQTILNNLQSNDESCCFIIKDLTRDVKRKGKIIEKWISRSKKGDLKAEKASHEIEELEDRYVINFDKNRYSTESLSLFTNTAQAYGFLCVTFQVHGENDQVLISDYQTHHPNYCEI